MRRLVLSFVVLFLAALAPARAADFTPAQIADLKHVSAAINAVKTLQGHFLQIAPDGSSSTGTMYLRKPGRMRFEYDPPSPERIVCDGVTVAVQNDALHTTDRYPLTDSPLRLLLGDNVDLASDPRIVSVDREPGLISITARQDTGSLQGSVTLTFSDPTLELRQWEVTDAQGLRTLVTLNNVRTGVDLSPRLFVIEEQNPFERRNE